MHASTAELDDDDYWAAVYHYALPENRDDLEKEFRSVVHPSLYINTEGTKRPTTQKKF